MKGSAIRSFCHSLISRREQHFDKVSALTFECQGVRRGRVFGLVDQIPRNLPQSLATFRGARPSRSLLPRVPLGSSVGGTPTEAVETTALPGIITHHPFDQGSILSLRIGVTYIHIVKTSTIGEAKEQLAELIAEAHKGAVIVLTDGEKQVWLDTQKPLDLETDNPELEAELLKGIEGPFTPYSSEEMRSLGERLIKEITLRADSKH